MNIENHYRCPVDVRRATDIQGYDSAALMLKVTYTLPRPGEAVRLADEQSPWLHTDVPVDLSGMGSALHEADLPYEKLHAEFLVAGTAYAPKGKACKRFPFGVAVGAQVKTLVAVGARTWQSGRLLAKASSIDPVVSVPAAYAYGFGGADITKAEDDSARWCYSNLAGAGYCSSRGSRETDGMRFPQLEPLDRQFKQPCTQFPSLGLGPVARNWAPRVAWAGTYDERWRERRWPQLPEDFDARFFQSAAQDQWLSGLESNQPVVLINMTPARGAFGSELRFNLPVLDYFATVNPRRGASTRLQLRPDTLILEPDAGRFTIVARKHFPLREGLHELSSVVFGDARASRSAEELTRISLPDFIKQLRRPRPPDPLGRKML